MSPLVRYNNTKVYKHKFERRVMENLRYSKHILMVEDDPVIRDLAKTYANIQKIKTDIACDGLEAITWINALQSKNICYSVIMTDLTMPTIDGLELLTQIGERVGKREILKPEIYVVSGGYEEGFEKVYQLGVKKVFKKPARYRDVFEAVKESYERLRKIE